MSEQFSEFLMNVTYAYVHSLEWRYGQTCFNILHSLDEDLADSIRGTSIDPFHDDDLVPEFLARVRDEWQAD